MSWQILILAGILVSSFILEHIFPLRKTRDQLTSRLLKNSAIALLAFPFTRFLSLPVVYLVINFTSTYQWGILPLLQMPPLLENLLVIVLLDYSLYWWHVSTHYFPLLWRFHQVHHCDKDMDSTTALRFHFGELLLSTIIRCFMAIVLGFKLESIMIFDVLVTGFSLFHHSNLKLHPKLEMALGLIIVTPLYHQSHHSFFQNETNSNFSTIFNFWDKVHKSVTPKLSPEQIKIGVPALDGEALTFFQLVQLPFIRLKSWPLELRNRD